MSKIFDEIKEGLEQALAYEKGEIGDVRVFLGTRKGRDKSFRRAKVLYKKKRLLKTVKKK